MELLNKIINMGFKLWLAVVIIIVGGWVMFFGDDTPPAVNHAENEMFLAYRANIYPDGQCNTMNYENTWILLCHPAGKAAGGLYEVQMHGDDYSLKAMNGVAQTHAEVLGVQTTNSNSQISAGEALAVFESRLGL